MSNIAYMVFRVKDSGMCGIFQITFSKNNIDVKEVCAMSDHPDLVARVIKEDKIMGYDEDPDLASWINVSYGAMLRYYKPEEIDKFRQVAKESYPTA